MLNSKMQNVDDLTSQPFTRSFLQQNLLPLEIFPSIARASRSSPNNNSSANIGSKAYPNQIIANPAHSIAKVVIPTAMTEAIELGC
jgi:hypothetical protein